MYRYQQSPPPDSPQSPPTPQGARPVAVLMPLTQPRLVFVLLGINVLLFMYYFRLSTLDQYRFLLDWGKVNEFIRDGEYYRLFTSMFLHLNLTHIVFNGYALYVLGRDVESLFGTARFAVIYFLGGLSGSLASFVFTDALAVGASGAIFAIFGAEMVYFYHHRKLHGAWGRRHLQQLVFLMVLNLGLGFFSTTGATEFRIDNAGHIGGLVGGVVLAWFVGPDYTVERDLSVQGGFRVKDENPVQRWVLPSILYAVGLAAVTIYAVSG